jgi:hypothetical protein
MKTHPEEWKNAATTTMTSIRSCNWRTGLGTTQIPVLLRSSAWICFLIAAAHLLPLKHGWLLPTFFRSRKIDTIITKCVSGRRNHANPPDWQIWIFDCSCTVLIVFFKKCTRADPGESTICAEIELRSKRFPTLELDVFALSLSMIPIYKMVRGHMTFSNCWPCQLIEVWNMSEIPRVPAISFSFHFRSHVRKLWRVWKGLWANGLSKRTSLIQWNDRLWWDRDHFFRRSHN